MTDYASAVRNGFMGALKLGLRLWMIVLLSPFYLFGLLLGLVCLGVLGGFGGAGVVIRWLTTGFKDRPVRILPEPLL